eukprot:CAMPEP_0196687878 /NCGR_PEP_ID=MMETSP1090-20130531/15681_1 /TAXON_ID=37098 /ORGANISM="Isochrysis sp, Strain CCMP1244" /LENGTH=201 /DNA_ID=CAMNT_0042026725 /DNA_START=335 /DNA_END=937 /DNA_ORIENTATION=-
MPPFPALALRSTVLALVAAAERHIVDGPLALAVNCFGFVPLFASAAMMAAAAACWALSLSRTDLLAFLLLASVAAWLWCVFTASLGLLNSGSYRSAGKHSQRPVSGLGARRHVQCFWHQCRWATVSDASLVPPHPTSKHSMVRFAFLSRSAIPAVPPPTEVVAAFAFAASSAAVCFLGFALPPISLNSEQQRPPRRQPRAL